MLTIKSELEPRGLVVEWVGQLLEKTLGVGSNANAMRAAHYAHHAAPPAYLHSYSSISSFQHIQL